jgi:hypothetical protein
MLLSLADPTAARRTEATIRDINPGLVAVDPLRDFAIGDLNSDADMAATVRELGRIARAGNTERAQLILHHARTGRAGVVQAFGLERAGFARNSKMLQTWARGVVNVIPGSEDDNGKLVLTCGKNSNGKEFAPIAVSLNPATMIYEVEPDFDIDEWRAEVTAPKPKRKVDIGKIVQSERRYKKAELRELVMETAKCSRAHAYRIIDAALVNGELSFNKRTKDYAKAA